MLRALLYGLATLHLGPGIAFVVLAFGCDPSRPILGAVCQGNSLAMFLGLTVVFWLLLGAGTAVMLLVRCRMGKDATASDG